ncbi:MAG TPA: phytanoyl-CoA dioxygenase family protein [Pyrinomonadaceae bacterium]|nr:phytanoyl-CoA dioxygenase family protein [Pyrinomonadaceae bacterium]
MQKEPRDIGYSTLAGVLSHQECDLIARRVKNASSMGRAGARNLMSNPIIADLAFDSRLLQLAADALGSKAQPFRATLFEKSGEANWHVLWHQDRALPMSRRFESCEWGPWTTKAGVLYALAPAWALKTVLAFRVHLDASTLSNGPLQVIPTSHEDGVLSPAAIQRLMSTRPAETCTVGRGGILAMRPLLLHSSAKALCDEPRRVIHIEYAESLDFGTGLRLGVA